jgi:replicative DNA helicase
MTTQQPTPKRWINETNSGSVMMLPDDPKNPAPRSEAAERAVIGAVLVNPNVLAQMDFLRAEDFFYHRHAYVWRAFEHIEADPGMGLDAIEIGLVIEKLKAVQINSMTALDVVGGPGYLTQLLAEAPAAHMGQYYGRIVQRAAIRRRTMQALMEAHALCRDENMAVDDLRDQVNRLVYEATDQSIAEEDSSLRAGVQAYLEQYMADADAGQGAAIPTGIPAFDKTFGGLLKREVSMLVAKRGMGKTSWMLNVVMNVAKLGVGVAIFSQEMTREQLIERMIVMETGIPILSLKKRQLDADSRAKMQHAVQRIQALPIDIITDIPRLTPLAFKRRLRKLKHQRHIGLVCIDGLWRMKHEDPRNDDKGDYVYKDIALQLSEIMRDEPEFNMPLLLLHQFNSDGMKGRPTARSIRGNAADDMHNVYVLHRESEMQTATELFTLKQRDGFNASIKLDFQKSHMRYIDPLAPLHFTNMPKPVGLGNAKDDDLSDLPPDELEHARNVLF